MSRRSANLLRRWLFLVGLICCSSCQSASSTFENKTGKSPISTSTFLRFFFFILYSKQIPQTRTLEISSRSQNLSKNTIAYWDDLINRTLDYAVVDVLFRMRTENGRDTMQSMSRVTAIFPVEYFNLRIVETSYAVENVSNRSKRTSPIRNRRVPQAYVYVNGEYHGIAQFSTLSIVNHSAAKRIFQSIDTIGLYLVKTYCHLARNFTYTSPVCLSVCVGSVGHSARC